MSLRLLIALVVGLASPLVGRAATISGPVRSAEVRVVGGVPTLLVNERPHNPLMFFGGPHRTTSAQDGGASSPMTAGEWQTKRPRVFNTFALAAKHNVHLHSFDVRLPWAQAGNAADYRDTEEAIRAVLARDPDGLLLLRFTMDPPEWWRDAHPAELMAWVGPDGTTGRLVERNYQQVKSAVSVASVVWRREAGEQLTRFVRHIEAKFGDHVLGYHFCGQHTHEWFYLGSRAENLNCAEEVFTEAWRRWLSEKYPTDEALRAAWNDPNAMIAAAVAPSYTERIRASGEFLRNPAREARTIDFHTYQNIAVVEALEHFARIIKRESRKLAVCFYGYVFEHGTVMHGVQQSGHLALGRLLKCPDIDAICSPISYNGALRGYNSRMPGGIAAFMAPVDSAALHGKLWFNEDDTRTHLVAERGQPNLASLEETVGVHQRNFAHLLVRGMSCWWMDLGGTGWLNDNATWENLGALARLYETTLDQRAAFAPEIAVIADEKSCYALTQEKQPLARNLLFGIRDPLYRIGAPAGYYLLEDFAAGLIPPKKLYIFVNCFALTAVERAAITRQCAGQTCVFLYANGLIDRSVDARNMEELLGVPLVLSSGKIAARCEVESHPLTNGVKAFGVEEIAPVISLNTKGGLPADTEVLARYTANGLPAVWRHRGAKTAIYIGALSVPVDLFHNIAAYAGVHLYAASGDVIEANERFVTIHAASTGVKTLKLPRRAHVREALTRRTVGEDIDSWNVTLNKGETRIFSLEYRERPGAD